jgi:hypothetical protein
MTRGKLPTLEGLPPSWTEYVRTLFEGKLNQYLCVFVCFILSSFPREERRNETTLYNPKTLGKLTTLEGLPPSWADYVRTLFEG